SLERQRHRRHLEHAVDARPVVGLPLLRSRRGPAVGGGGGTLTRTAPPRVLTLRREDGLPLLVGTVDLRVELHTHEPFPYPKMDGTMWVPASSRRPPAS